MFPTKMLPFPTVAEEPTCQYTLHPLPPLPPRFTTTLEFGAVVSVGAHLEDPRRVGIPLSVQLQTAGQLRGCREAVNSGNELHSAQIHAIEGSATMGARGLIVGRCQNPLCLSRHRAGLEVQVALHLRRLESRHRGRRKTAYVTDYECVDANVGDCRSHPATQICPPSQD
jgi:hypothetical protein